MIVLIGCGLSVVIVDVTLVSCRISPAIFDVDLVVCVMSFVEDFILVGGPRDSSFGFNTLRPAFVATGGVV